MTPFKATAISGCTGWWLKVDVGKHSFQSGRVSLQKRHRRSSLHGDTGGPTVNIGVAKNGRGGREISPDLMYLPLSSLLQLPAGHAALMYESGAGARPGQAIPRSIFEADETCIVIAASRSSPLVPPLSLRLDDAVS